MSFRTKVLSFVALGCIFCTSAAVYIARGRIDHDLTASLVNKSEAILTRLEASRRFVANQGMLERTIDETVKKYPHGNLPEETKLSVLKMVPIYASLLIGQDDARKDNYVFRVAAKEARRKENEADAQELEFISRFEEDSNLKQIVHTDEAGNAVWVMRPVRMTANDGCLSCHGNPSTSPYNNGRDVLGYRMENRTDGYLHGIFIIKSSLEPVKAEVSAASMNMMYWAGGLLAIALAVVVMLLRKPISVLDQITKRLKEAASGSMKSSQTLGSAAQSVASATSEQAAGVQETMASMSEMTSMINRTLELAKQTQDLSFDLDAKSKNGTQVMQGMVSSMESIKQSNEELKKMVQIISDISTKTNVINEIVFKTQLLSVNASIEAARAGQHGKGFAVVAEEVGNLAQVSGKAAEEIRDMLTKSQAHVQDVVNVTNTRVAEGERVSHEAMKSFVDISDGIKKIQSYSQSVSEATNQQQEGISQINSAMTQMDQASQQNSEMANEVNQLSDAMVNQSEELMSLGHDTEEVIYGVKSKTDEPQAQQSTSAATKKSAPKKVKAESHFSLSALKAKVEKVKAAPKANGATSNGNGHLHADDDDFNHVA